MTQNYEYKGENRKQSQEKIATQNNRVDQQIINQGVSDGNNTATNK